MTVRRSPIVLAAGAAALLLAGCSGLSSSNGDLPAPAIFVASSPTACGGAAGTGTLVLSDVGTRVVTDAPSPPLNVPVDRVEVFGTATGVDPTAQIILLMIPQNSDCPAADQAIATRNADGTFTGMLDLDDRQRVRIVAFAAPAGAAVTCGTADACITVAGYLVMSNAIGVSMR